MKKVLATLAVVVVAGAGSLGAHAHSDGMSCDESSMGLVPLVLNETPHVGTYVHCHNDDGTEEYTTAGAVYVHVPGVGYAGLCTDRDQEMLPQGFRLSPFYGAGDPTWEDMEEQGCSPYEP